MTFPAVDFFTTGFVYSSEQQNRLCTEKLKRQIVGEDNWVGVFSKF